MGMNDNNTPECFKNRKEALSWLQIRGQISQGKFYQDCNEGQLTIYPDKSLSKIQVAEYAEKVFGFIRHAPPLETPQPVSDYQKPRKRTLEQRLDRIEQTLDQLTTALSREGNKHND